MMSKGFAMYSGKLINIETFSVDDVCLDDIAHHLTKIQRYGGCLPLDTTYSVAEHSINLCKWLYYHGFDGTHCAHALLHDAAEAYLGDVVTDLKALLPDYKKIEAKIESVIFRKYNIQRFDRLIKEIDTRILLDESRELVPNLMPLMQAQLEGLRPLDISVKNFLNPQDIKACFLDLCALNGIKDDSPHNS